MFIRLNELKILPTVMMVIYALRASVNLNAIEQQTASYALLAAVFAGCLFSIYLTVRRRSISKTDLYVIFFLAIIAFSSLTHNTDIKEWIYICLGVIFLRFTFLSYQHDVRPLIIGLTIGLDIGVFAQLYQIVTNPAMWLVEETKDVTGYILGNNYNAIGASLLIASVLTFLCTKIHKVFFILLIPVLITSVSIPIIVGSMTAATSIILFILICLIPSFYLRRLCMKIILCAVGLFQFFVCFSGKGVENNDIAVWFIEDVLKKDITFTYRTYMWDSAIRVIIDSPIWGYGYPDKEWYLSNMSSFAIGPHNIIFAVLIFGGGIAFILYLYLILYSCFQTFNIRDYWADCQLAGITVLCLMMLMEAYPILLIFILITTTEYYPLLHQTITTPNEQ